MEEAEETAEQADANWKGIRRGKDYWPVEGKGKSLEKNTSMQGGGERIGTDLF